MLILTIGLVMCLAVDSVLQISKRTPLPVCMRTILQEPPHVCMARFNEGTVILASVEPEPVLIAPPDNGDGDGDSTDAGSADAPPVDTDSGPAAAGGTVGAGLEPPMVFVQFHGGLTRDASREISESLAADGWDVQGAAQGGEEVKDGPQGNVIRYYSPDYEVAAEELASALSQRLNYAPVVLQNFSKSGLLARPNLMEIWLSPVESEGS
jgi:hypothetical protein